VARPEDEKAIRAVKKGVGAHGRSAEGKDRAILTQAGPSRRTLAEVLASMPDVGVDADFQRLDSVARSRPVFD
jgi:plasmid stability protein